LIAWVHASFGRVRIAATSDIKPCLQH
jgi:hypothetical protein